MSLVQHNENKRYLALKKMDKKKILKMKQLEHIHNEKSLLEEVDHPFIVGLCVQILLLLKLFRRAACGSSAVGLH